MFNSRIFTLMMVLAVVLIAGTALAGAKLKIDDDSYIDLGYRLQSYAQFMDSNLDPASDGYESMTDFRLRRARLRMKGVINDKVSIFLQTDVSGKTVQMIDAFVNYKVDPWAQFVMGRNMAPSSRQATTSSGVLMAMDRPGIVRHSLTWGANGADVPSSPDRVRDNGLTLFGSGDMGEEGHLKYYLGVYNGVQYVADGDTTTADVSAVDGAKRVALRVQYNLWDAEGGYYNSSTYLGKKKTLGVGFSYEMQTDVGSSMASATAVPGDAEVMVDYALMTADAFLEYPMGDDGNSFTGEFGLSMLDFDDAYEFMADQGMGYYGQAGYYLASGFQPWFEFESFASDADEGPNGTPGDYMSYHVGVTYFIDGQHANVKLGFQSKTTDVPVMVGGSEEDTINTITLGFFTTY